MLDDGHFADLVAQDQARRLQFVGLRVPPLRARLQDKLDNGLDVSEAESTLALLAQTRAPRIADRDRLRRKFEAPR